MGKLVFAMVQSLDGYVDDVAGGRVDAVDASGHRTTTPASIPSLRALTTADTIRAVTPADFPLNLEKGPVVFVAEGKDSLHIVVGRNPSGSIDQLRANGLRFIVRLVENKFVIDSR